MGSRKLMTDRVLPPRTIGRREGTLPKNLRGGTKANRQKRKQRLAKVIQLPLPKDNPNPHGNCQGCQLCICARLEQDYGGKWQLDTFGVPERIEE